MRETMPRKAKKAVKGGCTGLAVLGQNCSSDLKRGMYELGDLGRGEREPISFIQSFILFFFSCASTEETFNQNNFKSIKTLYSISDHKGANNNNNNNNNNLIPPTSKA